MTIEVTDQEWDQLLLDYGLAMQARDDYAEKMRAASTVTEEQHFGDLWNEHSARVVDFRGKAAIMVKHLALKRAESWNSKPPTY